MKQDVDIVILLKGNQMESNDEKYMKEAYKEALKAYRNGEVPVGCVIVVQDKIIARAHNERHTKKCSIYHAEMLAIEKACHKLNRWILDDATIYVTLEPCIMCSGAIIQSRMNTLVYGIAQPKYGCVESTLELFKEGLFNHTVHVKKGLCEEQISNLMKTFFQELREKKKNSD